MRYVLFATGLALIAAVATAQPNQPPANRPEVKKTVDAFVGKWTGTSTITAPGKAPETVNVNVNCTKVALGAAVSCDLKSQGQATMRPDQTCLIAYDIDGNNVHLMCAMASGEVRDFQGAWSGDTRVQFQPLKTNAIAMGGGGPATTALTFDWPSRGTFVLHSRSTLANGQTSNFDLNLKRK
jgi:hypothetical protein